MKRLLFSLILALSPQLFAGYETGSADQVLRVPHAGGRPQFGQIDLSQSAAVKNQLPASKGGTGQDFSASTGIIQVNSGTFSAGTLTHTSGGTDVTSPGSAGNLLVSDGTNWTASAPKGDPQELVNAGLSASVATNALTVALKQADGSTNASSTSFVKIGFRNSTAATGGYVERTVTGSLSVVVPSTATLGHVSGATEYVQVYAQDNSGTVQLCVAGGRLFDEGSSVTSTTISTGATSRTVLYCTTGVTGPIRYLGRLTVSEATAGTWATAPSEVAMNPVGVPGVITGSSNVERIERAVFANNGSACSVSSQSGSWVSSVSRSATGDCAVTIAGSIFSAGPTCTCSVQATSPSSLLSCSVKGTPTSTSIELVTSNSTGANADLAFHLICMGPR